MPLTTSQVQSASRKRALEQSSHACPLVTSLVRLPFPPSHFSTSVNSLRLRRSVPWKLTRSYDFLHLWLCTFSGSPPHYRGLLIMLTVVKVVAHFLVPSCVPGASTLADFRTYSKWRTKAPFKTVFCKVSARATHSNACVFWWNQFLCTWSRGFLSEHMDFDCHMPLMGLVKAIKGARTVSTLTHLFLYHSHNYGGSHHLYLVPTWQCFLFNFF